MARFTQALDIHGALKQTSGQLFNHLSFLKKTVLHFASSKHLISGGKKNNLSLGNTKKNKQPATLPPSPMPFPDTTQTTISLQVWLISYSRSFDFQIERVPAMCKLCLSHQNFISVCSRSCLYESKMKAIGFPSGCSTKKDLEKNYFKCRIKVKEEYLQIKFSFFKTFRKNQ